MRSEETTVEEAKASLRVALAKVEQDNPVGATRQVVEVACRCNFSHRGSWTAFAWVAEQLTRPYFERRPDISAATAATMALCGLYDSKLAPERGTPAPRSGDKAPSRPKVRTVAIAEGAR